MKTGTKLAIGVGFFALFAMGVGGAKKMIGPTGEPQAVDATMFVGGGMDAPGIDITTILNAPVAEVYKTFTTSEGWKKFLEAETAIDLRIGGPWEVYFDPQAKIGSNGCQVLSYVPNEMVSFSWNTPPSFADERAKRTWVVVTFSDAGNGKAGVRLRHFGFVPEGKWPEVRTYFAEAWPNVLKALADSFQVK